jgi:flagellar basal body-associated protein FliL
MAEKKTEEKKSKKKLLMIVVPVVVLLVLGVGYKKMTAKKVIPPKKKVEGVLVPLANDFVVNLANGRYAKLTVALLVPEKDAPAAGKDRTADLPETPVIRSIITDKLTGLDAGALIDAARRRVLIQTLAKDLTTKTDTKVENVYFTDIAVQ